MCVYLQSLALCYLQGVLLVLGSSGQQGSSFPPLLATGDTRKGIPWCLRRLVTPVAHWISRARRPPLPIGVPCQLARKCHWQGLRGLSRGCVAAEGGGVPLKGDTLRKT